MKKQRKKSEVLIFSVFLVLAIIFSFVLISFNYKESYQDIREQTIQILMEETVDSIKSSMEFGKELENYYGMEETLKELEEKIPGKCTVVLLDGEKKVLYTSIGNRDVDIPKEGTLELPIKYENQQGSLLVFFSENNNDSVLIQEIKKAGILTAVVVVAFLVLFWVLKLFLKKYWRKEIFLIVAFFTVLLQGILCIGIFQNGYRTVMIENAQLIAQNVSEKIESVMEQGILLEEISDMDIYLKEKIEKVPILNEIKIVEEKSDSDENEISDETDDFLLHKYSLWKDSAYVQVKLSSEYIRDRVRELFLILMSTMFFTCLMIFELLRLPDMLLERKLRKEQENLYGNIGDYLRIIAFLCSMAEYLSLPYAAMLIRQTNSSLFGLSVGMTAALPIMIEGIVQTVAMTAAPKISEKTGGKNLLFFCVVIMLGANIAAFGVATAGILVFCRALAGLAYGGFKEAENLIITCGYNTPEQRSRNLSEDNAGLLAGTTCGAGLGAVVASAVGFQGTYLVSAVLFAVYGILAYRAVPWKFLEERRKHVKKEKEKLDLHNFRKLVTSGSIWVYFFVAIIPLNIGVILIVSLIPALCQKWEISTIILSYCYIVNGLGGIYLGPWLVSRFQNAGIRKAMAVLLLILAGALGVLKIPAAAGALLLSSFFLGMFDGYGTPVISDGFLELSVVKKYFNESTALMIFMVLCCVLNAVAPMAAEFLEGLF